MRVDLSEALISRESRVLSGRPRGELMRAQFDLDRLDRLRGPVEVLIPRNLYSMNTSFFLGLFGPSVRALGPERFREHYRFDGKPVHLAGIEGDIGRAIREETAFGKRTA
jgi:hypothetical protein